MKDIIGRRQTKISSGKARLWLAFSFPGLPLVLLPTIVFTASAQLTEDLQITANFTEDRPVTAGTSIELRLSRELQGDEGRIAVLINKADVTSLFIIDGVRLVYSPSL